MCAYVQVRACVLVRVCGFAFGLCTRAYEFVLVRTFVCMPACYVHACERACL